MKLALGTVQFGLTYGIANQSGQISLAQAGEVLALARANGIADLDTAVAYGDAEVRLGQMGVEGFRVVTKLPPLPVELPEGVDDAGIWARAQLTASLSRLGTDSVYGLLLHRSTDLLGYHGSALLRALQDFRHEGLVQKLGVSIYAPDELASLMPLGCWDLVQAPFNLIDRRLHASGWLQRLKDSQVEVHTRSAFLQGLLLTPANALPTQFSEWAGLWRAWDEWQLATGCSALSACLAFPQSFPEVDKVVVGVDGPDHLRGILAALRVPSQQHWPAIACDNDKLVNPSRWTELLASFESRDGILI
jgi:aryl-alcohol dehydrogenase-like predicted oxidoreductase